MDISKAKDILDKSGAWYSYGKDRIGQGKDNSRIFLKDNPEAAMEIENKIKDFISGSTEKEIIKTKGKPDAENDEQE